MGTKGNSNYQMIIQKLPVKLERINLNNITDYPLRNLSTDNKNQINDIDVHSDWIEFAQSHFALIFGKARWWKLY